MRHALLWEAETKTPVEDPRRHPTKTSHCLMSTVCCWVIALTHFLSLSLFLSFRKREEKKVTGTKHVEKNILYEKERDSS